MKRNDWILSAVILGTAVILFGYNLFAGKQGAEYVVINAGGDRYGIYDLHTDQEIEINGTNRLVISEGIARMTEADCPDQICVHQRGISKRNESIICLPNKVVVTIDSNEDSEIDAVAN